MTRTAQPGAGDFPPRPARRPVPYARPPSVGVELTLRHDLLGLAGAGPQQLHMRLAGLLRVVDPDAVPVARLEGDGPLVDLRAVRGGAVDHRLPVDPQPHRVVRDGGEGVRLVEAR